MLQILRKYGKEGDSLLSGNFQKLFILPVSLRRVRVFFIFKFKFQLDKKVLWYEISSSHGANAGVKFVIFSLFINAVICLQEINYSRKTAVMMHPGQEHVEFSSVQFSSKKHWVKTLLKSVQYRIYLKKKLKTQLEIY